MIDDFEKLIKDDKYYKSYLREKILKTCHSICDTSAAIDNQSNFDSFLFNTFVAQNMNQMHDDLRTKMADAVVLLDDLASSYSITIPVQVAPHECKIDLDGVCSFCHRILPDGIDYDDIEYCPRCGAKITKFDKYPDDYDDEDEDE